MWHKGERGQLGHCAVCILLPLNWRFLFSFRVSLIFAPIWAPHTAANLGYSPATSPRPPFLLLAGSLSFSVSFSFPYSFHFSSLRFSFFVSPLSSWATRVRKNIPSILFLSVVAVVCRLSVSRGGRESFGDRSLDFLSFSPVSAYSPC